MSYAKLDRAMGVAAAIGLVLLACDEKRPEDTGAEAPLAVIDPGAPAAGSTSPAPATPTVAPDPNARPLSVVSALPTGPTEGAIHPVVTFDRPVVALGMVNEMPVPVISITPPLRGSWRWMGSTNVEFIAEATVPLSTEYTVRVGEGLTALDGGQLKEAFVFTFSTPTLVPQFGDPVSQFNEYRWVKPDQSFEVFFSQRPSDAALSHSVVARSPTGETTMKALRIESILERERRLAKERGEPMTNEVEQALVVEGIRDHRVVVSLQPVAPLASDTPHQLVFKAGLESAEGPLKTAAEVAWTFRTYGPLKMTAIECAKWDGTCAEGPVTLRFTNPVKVSALKKALTSVPPVKFDWPDNLESQGETWALFGNFKPTTSYVMTVDGAVVDAFGQSLGASVTTTFKTGSYKPTLIPRSGQALLERGLRAAIPVTHVNMPDVQVDFARLDPTSVIPWLQTPWRADRPLDFKTARVKLEAGANQWKRSPIDLDPLFAASPVDGGGQVGVLRLTWGEGPERASQTSFVQVTDLAVHAKLGAARSEVWVWSLKSGASVPNAKVELVDAELKVVSTATSDAKGIAVFPGIGELPVVANLPDGAILWGPPFLAVRATLGDDVGLTAVGDGSWTMSGYRFGVEEAWESTPPSAEGLVFTDRGIYRPGDPLYVKGFIRERSLGRLRTPAGHPLTVELVEPAGEVLHTQTVTASAYGGFDTKFDLPREGALGDYSVRVTDPSTKLVWQAQARMAEFRAPEFLVQVNAHADSRLAGDTLGGIVEGRYLFGAAMPDAAVDWTLTASAGRFEPVDAAGFVFGRRYAWWDADFTYSEGRVVATGTGRLDAKGQLAVLAGKSEALDHRPQTYQLEASVTDVNRQVVSSRKAFDIHPAAHYIGLRGPSGFAEAKVPFDVQVVSIDSFTQARTAGVAAKVTLKRHEWKTVQKQTVSGTFETVSEKVIVDVKTCAVTTSTKATVPCTFVSEAAGYHEIVAESQDAKGRPTVTNDSVWMGGEGYAAWMQDDDNRVEIVADKATYDVGETARFLVQSPYPEAEAWVTVEREGVLSHQRLRLKGTATPITLPITEAMIPNVFVGVTLARGRVSKPTKDGDAGRPSFKVGFKEVRVVPSEKRLRVVLTPDAPEKRPGSDLSIDVLVQDRRGKGTQAEVAVWAVDEGVLSLTSYKTPDPIDLIFRPRGSSVRQATNVEHLVPQLIYGEKGKEQGGGGAGMAEAEELRSRFVTTPIFVGQAITGEDGKTTVKGKLPDNLTTFRLMAVAITQGDRAGNGESKVIVNKPLMARPALPRSARVGDKFAAGVVIHSMGGKAMAVEVVATVVEGGLKLLDRGPRVTNLEPDRGREVRFSFQATDKGKARLRFVVRAVNATAGAAGSNSDQVEVPLEITLPTTPETVAVYGDTPDSVTEALVVPGADKVQAGFGGLTLTLASSALSGLGDDAERLIDYPFGCLEQQSSRLVPLVALKSLLDTYGKTWLGERDPREVVSTAVKAITRMQQGDGGFAYWPGEGCSSYFGTAYATLALGEAAKVGYLVDTGLLDRSRKYLVERYDVRAACEWGERLDEERALALYVLARAEQSQRQWARQLFARRDGLALFGKALLTSALAAQGTDVAAASTLVKELLNAARVEPGKVHFQETDKETYAPLFSSDIRTTALALQALLRVEPNHPFVPQIARFLIGARTNAAYRTTQEAAFSLMALGDYAHEKELNPPDFKGSVALGGATLVSEAFVGRSLSSLTKTLDWSALRAGTTPASLVFAVNGQGRLYYGASLRYAPVHGPTEALERGLVVQRWYEPVEAPGQARQVRSVSEGALVRVRVRVATAQQRHFVAVIDPLPSGLEAVDTTLSTSARSQGAEVGQASDQLEGDDDSEALGDEDVSDWYSVFNHVELRDDRLLLFADHLPPGVHSYSYVARATTAGTFVLPPAHAEGMYAPEVFGRSDGGTFWVHPQTDVTSR